ncbi:MAG: TetR/AcrR family transcriptional regulator [Chloroflexi bacterium]|nr:TetR/AcrR family transcriptional regulator [Anaerolineaceae bacterium]NMB89792.1 TetR/AcrR family transcriptional regulator [Chloroflexota bacterium]
MSPTHRSAQKERTREKLLQVALSEFSARGVMATRMSDVARAAGVSHGTVFAHFETQAALITAVIETFGPAMTRRIHELASDHAGLRSVLSAHLGGIREYEAFYTRLVLEARFLPRAARDTFILIQSAVSFHISQVAEAEMEAGHIRPASIPLLFNTWVGLVHYYLANADLFAPGGSVIDRYGDALVDHFINLISTGQTGPNSPVRPVKHLPHEEHF